MDSIRIDQPELRMKVQKLRDELSRLERVAVAFSGGVDSSLLLKIASDHLGQNVIAFIATSPTFPPQEEEEAIALAQQMDVTYELIATSEMQDPEYLKNPPNRCFYCRMRSMAELLHRAEKLGFHHLLDGANADDRADDRPGREAAMKLGVISPLLDAGLTKEEIRQLARSLEFPVWDKPSSACLATRIPYGTPITIQALQQINKAEIALKKLGFRDVRVRHYHELARIELPLQEFPQAMELRDEICKSLRDTGYAYVTLDLEGFRSGSMNLTFASEKSNESRKNI